MRKINAVFLIVIICCVWYLRLYCWMPIQDYWCDKNWYQSLMLMWNFHFWTFFFWFAFCLVFFFWHPNRYLYINLIIIKEILLYFASFTESTLKFIFFWLLPAYTQLKTMLSRLIFFYFAFFSTFFLYDFIRFIWNLQYWWFC